jgi:hypothetical protein
MIMNLSHELQLEIAQIATSQGISPEQFVVQTLMEKINSLKQRSHPNAATSSSEFPHRHPQLQTNNGLLVIDTVPLSHVDFNTLIDQLRAYEAAID